LDTEYRIAHGMSNAIMLPHVMKFNLNGNLEKHARIAVAGYLKDKWGNVGIEHIV